MIEGFGTNCKIEALEEIETSTTGLFYIYFLRVNEGWRYEDA